MRILVVNADDFGQTEGINRGIARAHEEGVVTSTSLMTRFGAAAGAAGYARAHPELAVGLHVDFGEAIHRDGGWEPLYTVPDHDEPTVRAEVERQLAAFRKLVGGDPTHLDSHQHAHTEEPVRSVVLEVGERLGVPVRHFTPGVRYRGEFYGHGRHAEPAPELISVDALVNIVRSLEPGVTELSCHPGEAAGLRSGYLDERERELETLCDPRVRAAIEEAGVVLRSFRDALTPSGTAR